MLTNQIQIINHAYLLNQQRLGSLHVANDWVMVFFTCNACGASLKKNQVEKHYRNECRQCNVLSCMDCGQDFYGEEYAGHTKCVSEAEKYQGAMYKGSASKGDQKQEAWLEVCSTCGTFSCVACALLPARERERPSKVQKSIRKWLLC